MKNTFRVIVSIPFTMDDEEDAKTYLNAYLDVSGALYQGSVTIRSSIVKDELKRDGVGPNTVYTGQIEFVVNASSQTAAESYFLTEFKDFIGILFKNAIPDKIEVTIVMVEKGKTASAVLAAFAVYAKLNRFGNIEDDWNVETGEETEYHVLSYLISDIKDIFEEKNPTLFNFLQDKGSYWGRVALDFVRILESSLIDSLCFQEALATAANGIDLDILQAAIARGDRGDMVTSFVRTSNAIESEKK